MNRLEPGRFILFFEGKELHPASLDKNMIGFCAQCDAELNSFAYYRHDLRWLVSANCRNHHLILVIYDSDWNWLGDQQIEMSEAKNSISSIPREKLAAIFTPAEIRDMLAYESRKPFTRQNLYRARTKFEKFEKLFGIKIKF